MSVANKHYRFSKPVYEILPYLYMAAGLCGFIGAYLLAGKAWSDLSLAIGVIGMLGGLVVLLRRRDYRSNQAHYKSGSLDDL